VEGRDARPAVLGAALLNDGERHLISNDLYDQGKLADAIASQRETLAATPDPAGQLFLSTLLMFTGDLDAAQAAVDAVPFGAEWAAECATHGELIAAERARWQAFEDGTFPAPDDAPEHLKCRWRAIASLFDGTPDQVIDGIDQADAYVPNLHGHIDGREFFGIRDADDLFGTVVEVFEAGEYRWLAFEELKCVKFVGDDSPREDIYREVQLTRADGRESRAFLPVLYFGTHMSDDEAVRMGLETDFFAVADGPLRGIGRRIWLIGDEELTLPDCRQLDVRGSEV